MSFEAYQAKHYNPFNITPEHLFVPPTFTTHPELIYLIKQLTSSLEGGGARQLRIGTELEMFFFAAGSDPYEDKRIYGISDKNPNYNRNHLNKMLRIQAFGVDLHWQNPRKFLDTDKFGRIFFEFHTAPQSSSGYLHAVNDFGERLRAECKKLDVLPVVHSQHLHISLREKTGVNQKVGIDPDRTSVRDIFSSVNPLVLLPEEWKEQNNTPLWSKNRGIGPHGRKDLNHVEFRKLSTEYANDPVLNLRISLRAMYAGCVTRSRALYQVSYPSYDSAVRAMRKNKELEHFFGASTLATLAHIVAQYPDVSTRKITVDQVSRG